MTTAPVNLILAGDRPDPTVLSDGDDYYLTYSSFEAAPGLPLWHSRDLLSWEQIGFALPDPPATVFASDLIKHGNRYFLYIPFIPASWAPEFGDQTRIAVIWADALTGPWSDPIDLGITGHIDPGHAVGEDGRRYLFLSGVSRVRLTDDGLATDGPVEHVYDGWRYPDEWVTEAYALEGPKLLQRGDYFYLISAVGGTAGPPTGHMVIVARSRSIDGPWENDPSNPVVKTWSGDESWWSRGHATAVAGPDGQWWLVYHGYENGYRTLGRQILLEPIAWTEDGWFRSDTTRSVSVPRPSTPTGPDSWSFHAPSRAERDRLTVDGDDLILAGKGSSPADASPLCLLTGDHRYDFSARLDLVDDDSLGGLLLFFNSRLFLGLSYDGSAMITYSGGQPSHWREPVPSGRFLHLRIVNDEHIVSLYYGVDGQKWTRHGIRFETSGYHANTAGDLLSLRPALFAAGSGTVRFSGIRYVGG